MRVLRSRWFLLVAGILLVALALRLGEVARSPYVPIGDARFYLRQAQVVAHTGGYPTSSKPGTGSGGTRGPTALFPPGFPYFLAMVDLLDGHTSPRVAAGPARISQAVLGTVTVALIGLVALEAFGAEVGVAALALAAIYPVLIETSAVVVAENLLIALELAAVYCGLRIRRAAHPYRWTVLAGVLAALQLLELEGSYAWESSTASIGLQRGFARIGVLSFWAVLILAVLGALTSYARRAPRWIWLVPILFS